MANRDELEKEAKKVGVPEPEAVATKGELQDKVEVAKGVKSNYNYPEYGVTVVAETREEADAILQEEHGIKLPQEDKK